MARKSYDLNGVNGNVELGKGGPRVKDSSGAVEHRNNADDAYSIVRGADPVTDNDLATKGWVEKRYGIKVTGQINGGSPPAASSYGRIFICTTAGGAYTLKYLYRDTGSAWEEIVPVEGMTIGITDALTGGTDEYEADTVYIWDADAGTWNYIGPVANLYQGLIATREVSLTFADTGDNNVGAAVPSGATVISIVAQVTQAFNGTGNALKIGDATDDDRLMTTSENDLEEAIPFETRRWYTYGAATQIVANIANTGGSQGQVQILVTYKVP